MLSSKNYMQSCSYFSVLWNNLCKLQNIASVSFKIALNNKIISLLSLERTALGINLKTLAMNLHELADPADYGSIMYHHAFPGSLKAASEALAWFFPYVMLLFTIGHLCLLWPSLLVHSAPLLILHILILQVFQLEWNILKKLVLESRSTSFTLS